jgi:hypothetical protein
MMKKKYLRNLFPLLIAGILMGSLSACSQSEELSQEENNVEDQKIAIQPEVLMDGVATRAGMELKDLTYFYLRIVNPQSTEYSYFVKMEKDASGNWYASKDLKNNTTNPTLYFQNGKQQVTVQALYWKSSSVDNFMARADEGGWKTPYTFFMSTSVFNSLSLKSSDPLYYSKTIVPQTDAPGGILPISFKHRFAKIHLRLEFDSYCTNLMGFDQSAMSEVSFGGLLTGNSSYLKWDFNANSFNYNGDTRDQLTTLNYLTWNPPTMTTNTSSEYELMAVPQLIPNGALNASFSIYGEIFSWTYQGQDFNLESNTEYDITLQVNGEDPTTKGTSTLNKKNIKIIGSIKEIKGGQQ